MIHAAALWLPALVATVAVFMASAVVWMAMPHHKKDFAGAEDEDGLMDAVRKCVSVAPGMYYFPFAKWGQENADAYKDKVRAGPVGILRVRDPKSALDMRSALIKAFLQYAAINAVIALLAAGVVGTEAHFAEVFHVTGLAAFLAYGFVGVQESIWFGLPGKVAVKHAVDGLVYAVITGAVFGWLRP